MATRYVTNSGKDSQGNITSLCNPTEWWSPRPKANAVIDINSGAHTYYTINAESQIALVRVVGTPPNEWLQSASDAVWSNNLDNLPDC